MTKILIVGSQSFIGKSFLIYSKFSDVYEVSLIERRPEDIDFSGIDVVIHLAAIVHQFKKTPESEYYKINRDLCLKVAENAKQHKELSNPLKSAKFSLFIIICNL